MNERVAAGDPQILSCELARGSVLQDLATHAGRPVLFVPPPAKGTV